MVVVINHNTVRGLTPCAPSMRPAAIALDYRAMAGEAADNLEDAMVKVETKPAEAKAPVMTAAEAKMTTPMGAMPAWRPFESLRREVDRLFEDFAVHPFRLRRPAFDIEPFWRPEAWIAAPPMDLVEGEKAFELTAEMPGVAEKDIEVKVVADVLTIKGKTEEAKEEKNEGYHLKERRYGAYERSVRIPETVEMGKIEAAFKNGVLTVTMPKVAEAQTPARAIPVKAA